MRRRTARTERALGERLRAAAPLDAVATARAEAAVLTAYAAREPRPQLRRGRRAAAGALLAAALVTLLGALVLSPAGARVGGWIEHAIGPPPSSPAAALPAPGRLLVSGRDGSWIVERDLRTIPLGEFTAAGWSAQGNYALLDRGDALFARDLSGTTRWSLTRPSITHAAWSGGDGYRVAYRSGAQLRVVNGDGSGDRLLERRSAAVTPAWRPGPPHEHVLAYATPRGRVGLRDADDTGGSARAVLAPAPGGAPVAGLAWVGPDRLLVLRGGDLLLLDARGRVHARAAAPAGARFAALTASSATRTAAFVQHALHGATSVVWTVRLGARDDPAAGAVRGARSAASTGTLLGGRARIAFAGSGMIRSLAFSPDGRWLAFAWPPSDQWIFQRVRGRPQLSTIGRATRRLGHVGGPAGSAIVGWAR